MRHSTSNDLNYYFIFVVPCAGYNVQICGLSKYEIFAGILIYPYHRICSLTSNSVLATKKSEKRTIQFTKKKYLPKNLQLITVVWRDWYSGYCILFFFVFLYFYVNRLRIENPQCVREWICLSLLAERHGSLATIVHSAFSQLGRSRWLVITLRCIDLYCSFKMYDHTRTKSKKRKGSVSTSFRFLENIWIRVKVIITYIYRQGFSICSQ
jgi:hypothetical protein